MSTRSSNYPSVKPFVTIVIATKNEGEGLAQIIASVKPYAADIMVIDGHSKDDTVAIAKRAGVRFMLDHGVGRGDAVRMGIEEARGKVILFFDADGSHEAKDIPQFILPIMNNEADLVIGSRRTGGSFDLNMDFSGILRSGGADFLTYLVNRRFNTQLSDIIYSFRAVKKSVGQKLNLTSDGFTIEQEMVVKCLKKNYRLLEIPSREKMRGWGKSKLNTLTGVGFVWHLIKEMYLTSV